MDILQKTHKLLCTKIISLYSQYGGRRIVNRIVKHRLISDIINLGSSNVNGLDNKELSKIFLETLNKDVVADNVINLADLIQTLARLSERVNRLETEVTRLKASNARLQ